MSSCTEQAHSYILELPLNMHAEAVTRRGHMTKYTVLLATAESLYSQRDAARLLKTRAFPNVELQSQPVWSGPR